MKKVLFAVILITALYSNSYSQEIIDLPGAIKVAINNNTTISQLKNNLDIQKLNIKNVKGDLYPNLAFTSGWSRSNSFSNGGTIIQNGIPIPISEINRWQSTISLGLSSSVTLFNGFSNYRSIDLEEQNYMAILLNLDKAKYDLVMNIYVNFFDVLKKDKIVEVNQQNLKNSQDQLQLIKEYVNVGKKTVSDIYKQDVQVAQDELNLETSKNEFEKSKVVLLTTMNDNLDKSIVVTPGDIKADFTLVELKKIVDDVSNVEPLVNNAVKSRFDYKIGLSDIELNQTKLDIATKNLYWPTLSAYGNYNFNGDDYDNFYKTRTLTFGLSLNYSIFQGFNLDVPKQIAEINIKQKSEDLRKLEQQIRSDIKKSILDLQSAYKQIEILDRNIASAEQDRYLSEENYKVGYGTLLDVQTASIKLNNLQIQRINAYFNFFIARKQIDYLSGKLSY